MQETNTPELQHLKMAWLAAKEAGDTQAQLKLLRDHPEQQTALIDFIATYHATTVPSGEEQAALLPLTQRALQTAMQRVFSPQEQTMQTPQATTLAELRKSRNLSKVETARALRLSVEVWSKFEAGAIELISLSQRQLNHLALFFQVSVEQFSNLLNNSQPALTLNRRQTRDAAQQQQQGPRKQSFAEAVKHSTMSKEDKKFWSGM
ncbi:MAG: helix-turn-helix transcriptional regulator [Ktedonobacteraceae bacterium]|nr:helix-turn-helix transcriptional regulator [Ktedonobacteraceae bacterium]